jgi:putative oxidoreductase
MVRRLFVTTTRFHSGYRSTTDSLNKLVWLPNLLLRLSVGFMFFSGAVGKLGWPDPVN